MVRNGLTMESIESFITWNWRTSRERITRVLFETSADRSMIVNVARGKTAA